MVKRSSLARGTECVVVFSPRSINLGHKIRGPCFPPKIIKKTADSQIHALPNPFLRADDRHLPHAGPRALWVSRRGVSIWVIKSKILYFSYGRQKTTDSQSRFVSSHAIEVHQLFDMSGCLLQDHKFYRQTLRSSSASLRSLVQTSIVSRVVPCHDQVAQSLLVHQASSCKRSRHWRHHWH